MDIFFRFFSVMLAGIVFSVSAHAANITIIRPESRDTAALVLVEGDFELGDDKSFTKIALQLDHAIVVFSSDGGNLSAGLGIGKAIRLRQYDSFVMTNSTCASACAIAWLGGIHRYMQDNARIGFHAAYNDNNGQLQESGIANALIGSYLNQLGLPENAIGYITHAAPQSMQWLNVSEARANGIDVQPAPSDQTDETTIAQPLQNDNAQDYRVAVGIDLFGFDLPNMPLHNMTWANCSEACSANKSCQAFTFNRKSRTCFLKENADLAVLYAPATSGYKDELTQGIKQSSFNILQRTDVVGGDFRNLGNSSMENCLRICDADSACRAFSFTPKNRMCWLKSAANAISKRKGVVSGVK